MTKQDLNRKTTSAAGPMTRFGRDRSGNVTMLFGMMAVVLTLSVGAAVDLGRWLHARDQTAGAIDAAVLAGVRYLQTNSTDQAGAINAAKKFYTQNVTSRLNVTDDTVAFAVTDNGASVTSSGGAYIATPFLQLANISKLPLFPTAKAERHIGNKEVAIMLDVTGSMCGSPFISSCSSATKLDGMKTAANQMIDIMLPEGQSNYSAKVAIIPFSEEVRLPTTAALNAARGTVTPTCKRIKDSSTNGSTSTCTGNTPSGYTDYYLAPCAVERTGSEKYTDTGPGTSKYAGARFNSETTGSGSSKAGDCTLPTGSEILPLTNDRTSLINKINGLKAKGGTAGQIGTAWAWYTLSPNWNSLWPSSAAQAYGAGDLRKIAVLMTDGDYNTVYDKNGIHAIPPTTASVCGTPAAADPGGSTAVNAACAGSQALSQCSAMKAKGIEIYTIGFNVGDSSTAAYKLLSQCASDINKFYAPVTNDQLQQAFRDIGLKLSDLYLSK
jgi:Flp pilus assembly protein TadG